MKPINTYIKEAFIRRDNISNAAKANELQFPVNIDIKAHDAYFANAVDELSDSNSIKKGYKRSKKADRNHPDESTYTITAESREDLLEFVCNLAMAYQYHHTSQKSDAVSHARNAILNNCFSRGEGKKYVSQFTDEDFAKYIDTNK